MSRSRQNNNRDDKDTGLQVRTRSVRVASPKDKKSVFTELYAHVYPANPTGSTHSTQNVKLKLAHNSSLPPLKKYRKCKEKPPPVSNRDRLRKKNILVSYEDDGDSDTEDDSHSANEDNEMDLNSSSAKFDEKRAKKSGKFNTFKLLETKPPPTNENVMNPLTFYNKAKSPKSYRRLVSMSDNPKSNGSRMNPLRILKVPSRNPSQLSLDSTTKIFPPFNGSSREPSSRRSIHREPCRNLRSSKNSEKMETIDLIDCEETPMSTVLEPESSSNNSVVIPSAPPADLETDPDFRLSYDDEVDPPPISFRNRLGLRNEATDQLRMEIRAIHFGSLKCKPLDLLEVDKESFKLHIQIKINGNTFEQLLNIQAGNIELIDLHKLKQLGYLRIKPKEDKCKQLSHNLNIRPGLYLNNSELEHKKFITMLFDNTRYSLSETYSSLKGLFDFPIDLAAGEDNFRFIMYDDSASPGESSHKDVIKSNSKLTLFQDSPNITLSSSDSPVYTEDELADREKEHSYCDSKRGNPKPPDVIQEFNQLIESVTDKLLTYPAVGHSRRITIDKGTVSCLQPEMFLNDTIIEFYLLYMYHAVLSQTQREQVHIFNTFFYTKLTNNLSSQLNSQNLHEKHRLVSKWTKNVDLFEKDFILIPIHDHAHWLLAIICYPSLAGSEPIFAQEDGTICVESVEPAKCLRNKRTILKLACILIFDSLAIKRNDVISNLRFYLQAEWDARYKSRGSYTCTTNTLVGHHPKLPIQPNSCDCGLFVMQYAESFFTNSLHDFKFPIKLDDWFSLDEIKHKRNLVIKLIFDLSKNENYKQI